MANDFRFISRRLTGITLFILMSLSAYGAEASTMIILDGSGSMWGQIDGRSKIEIARDVVGDVVSDTDANSSLGLMAYGHRREADCADIEILVKPGPDSSEAIRKYTDAIVPRGKTPIGNSIIQAAEALQFRTEKATVVLVSDGIENCGVDLCKLAETLEAEGIDFTTHIIGFDLGNEEISGLECLASGTGGRFFSANDASQLGAALRETVLPVQDTTTEQADRVLVEDIVIRGSDVIFLAGRDDVTIPPRGPEHDPHFLIKRHSQLAEPLMETFPPFLMVQAGSVIRVLDLAQGGINFFPQLNAPGWGPAGQAGSSADIEALGGISGYKGPRGALLGVFMDDQNRADHAPPSTIDFFAPGAEANDSNFVPELGQVFYIGDGTIGEPGEFREFIAPRGATRLFFGIADGWAFQGAPGYYDDNDGEYTVRVGVNTAPE